MVDSRVGSVADFGGKTSSETPRFRNEVEAWFKRKELALDLAEEVETKEVRKVEAKSV